MQANDPPQTGMRERYQRGMIRIRRAFDAGETGHTSVAARATLVDDVVRELWTWPPGVALVAVGGYGRQQLFPFSDVDLMFLLDAKVAETDVKESIRRISQQLWDCGIRLSPATRKLVECGKFDPTVPEFTLSLLDHRLVAGDAEVHARLAGQGMPRLLQREGKAILNALLQITRERHKKYGDTLFHLEPNIKECPGGLRDVHVCGWIDTLRGAGAAQAADEEFGEAVEFLMRLRCFLHDRHERDDNTLDWQTQDEAATERVGLPLDGQAHPDAAYWMRVYFRHARAVKRLLARTITAEPMVESAGSRLRAFTRRRPTEMPRHGYTLEQGRIALNAAADEECDPACDPDVVLQLMVELAATGPSLDPVTEKRLSQALPLLSSQLEEGPAIWLPLRALLTGRFAGDALRIMHAIGLLELLIPEFHGIDALVIRDAYHRYTVDEHTFVAIDTLHRLAFPAAGPIAEWTAKFSAMLRDLAHPELLYLAALLHDTGKGRSTGAHAAESVSLARGVVARLELDEYESGLVLLLIENHLEMSVALRRDIFDAETVRVFAAKVGSPEALRMLTLFTYADIDAVHPDALTPWKAENIWRLYIATSNFLDRSVDQERVSATAESELVHRVAALLPPNQRTAMGAFLEGFPERYLRTRTPEQVRAHYLLSKRFAVDPLQIELRYAPGMSEITLVTPDGPLLFATMAGTLAAWGMNIVTADGFSNGTGVVVDTMRFTDGFRTLELNESERDRLVASLRDVVGGRLSLDTLLQGRRRATRKAPMVAVIPRVEFDDGASSRSTLLQVVARDAPGLLRALSVTLAQHACNIEAALVDTEGETAIDVFYLTKRGSKLTDREQAALRSALQAVVDQKNV